jgi:UDP-D-galactose:(glucosyl)LPS alpha-1,6-D-galactosyltransferase
MTILSLTSIPQGRGGLETVMKFLDHELSLKGQTVMTALAGAPLIDSTWLQSFRHVEVGQMTNGFSVQRPWNALRLYCWLKRIVNHHKPNVVIVHDPFYVPVLAVIRATTPVRRRFAIVAYEHGIFAQLTPLSLFARSLYRVGLRQSDTVLCGGDDIAESLRQRLGISAQPIGIPVSWPAATLPRSDRPFHLVYVGRFDNAQKRVDRLLRACAALPSTDWRLQLVGDGPDRDTLEQLAHDLGIADRCLWSGWQADPWSVISQVSLLAFPSDWEGFGAVVVEAMARGIPVLATNCDYGPRTIIRDGVNGWLVPKSDQAFSETLTRIVSGQLDLPHPEVVRSTVAPYHSALWAERLWTACQKTVIQQQLSASHRRAAL